MPRFVPRFLFAPALILVLTLGFSSCGGGGSSSGVPTTVTISPTNLSLNRGVVVTISATATDAKNVTLGGDITWASDNSNLVSVTSVGTLCAGKWQDSTNVVCIPAQSDGTDGKPVGTPLTGVATITATMKGVSGSIKVYVHGRVDRVSAAGPAGSTCASMTETQQFTATAYSSDAAVCAAQTPPASAPCALPASTVGPATWGSSNTSVVSLDNTVDKAGLATAGIPGRSGVIATLAGVNSPIVPFETCRITSVSLAIKDSAVKSFTVDKAGTQTLVATAVDSKGTTLTAPPLSFLSSQPFAISAAAQSTVTNATATALNPGTSTLVASCSPPNCNVGIYPIYSNAIIGTVNGTAAGTVYAASTDSTSLVPIDVAGNTTATAVTLPRAPDSMVVNRQGTKALLGATLGIMVLDTASNAVTNASRGGTVLGFMPDGSTVAVVDTPNHTFGQYILSSGAFQGGYDTVAPIASVDASIDSSNFFGVNGTANYYSLFQTGYGIGALSTPAVDIATSGTGSVLYLAGGTAAGIDVRAFCNSDQVDTQAATNPKLIRAIPDGSGAVAVDDTSLVVLHNANISSACPPVVAESRSAVPLGLAAGFVPKQVLVTPDSSKAIISTDKGLVVVNLSTLTPTKIALGAGATGTFTGGVTLDSKTAYFGGSDGTVHRIDLSALTDAQQIAVNLKKSDGTAAMPNLVVVRNK